MTSGSRWLIATLLLGVFLTPLATAQTLYSHLRTQGAVEFRRGWENPGVIALTLLVGLGFLPLFGLIRAAWIWWMARKEVAGLIVKASPYELHAVPYLQVAGEEVVLFTAGVWRPFIVVSENARARSVRSAMWV